MQAAVPPGVVVGGPPAYLEAHGIRYVPASTLGADPSGSCDADSSVDQAEGVDYRVSAEPAYVSKQDLEARVDDRIRKFMGGDGARKGGVSSAAGGYRPVPMASRGDDVRARLKQLRDECSDAALASSGSGRVLRSGRRLPPADYDY